MKTYRVLDCPNNGTVGQDCGVFDLASLPARLRDAIAATPEASEWMLPALSGGDTGEELPDVRVIVRQE